MKKSLYEIGGYAFSDEKAAEKALREIEGIRYIKDKTDMENPEMVLQIYRQMVGQQLFETPVGYHFLYELQEYLKAVPSVKKEDIPPIPIYKEETEPPRKTVAQEKAVKNEKAKTARQPQKQVKNVDFKSRFRTSLVINIILLLMIAGMFAVTATSGNINILNYENALIEKYENWEQQLEEREEKLREREQNIGTQESSVK